MTDKEERRREQQRASSKKYYASHTEQRKAYGRAYYEKHKNDPEYIAKQREIHNRWISENRDKWNAYLRERRAAKKGATDERAD